MIRTESEYMATKEELEEARARLAVRKRALDAEGLSKDEIERELDPVLLMHSQMEVDVQWYEDARARRLPPVPLANLGAGLIALRIANGVSQRELANRLKVHESTVSRDERNEYHGITIERAERVAVALGEQLHVPLQPATQSTTHRISHGATIMLPISSEAVMNEVHGEFNIAHKSLTDDKFIFTFQHTSATPYLSSKHVIREEAMGEDELRFEYAV